MNVGVPPSGLGTQPIGEVSPIIEGVFQLKLPVPFPLKFIASYLLPGEDGWTIIDPGFDYTPAREAWEAGAAEVGGRDAPVHERITRDAPTISRANRTAPAR